MMNSYPTLDRHQLGTLLGSGRFLRFSHAVRTKIERFERQLNEVISPRVYDQRKKVESVGHGCVVLEGGLVFHSAKLSRTMASCVEVVAFIATIGHGIEREIERLTAQNHLSDAYILDAMGSVLIENMVENYCRRMQFKCRSEGKDVTLRFSPGYCDWPITDQLGLFGLFDTYAMEIQLTDAFLMSPRKSISGVFGILPSDRHRTEGVLNPCTECAKERCAARRH